MSMKRGLNRKMNNTGKRPSSPKRVLDILLQISLAAKMPLCLMVGFSAGFGYILANPRLTPELILCGLGIFLLSCGAATFNSIQERDLDRRYARTRNRPLVTGRLSVTAAACFGATSCLPGLAMLRGAGENLLPVALGLTALLLYNCIYTPLKQITPFALIPGGIAGALPPYIGWICARGTLFHPLIWGVMGLLFLWQPPHFCLVLLEYAGEYRVHRTFKTLVTLFPVEKVKRIIAVWLLSFTCTVLFLASLPGLMPQPARLVMVIAAPLFLLVFLYKLFFDNAPRYRKLFISLNGFMFSIMFVLTLSSILETL